MEAGSRTTAHTRLARYTRVLAALVCFLVSGLLPHPPGSPEPVALAGEQLPGGEEGGHEAETASVAARPGQTPHGVADLSETRPADPYPFPTRAVTRSHSNHSGQRPALFHLRC